MTQKFSKCDFADNFVSEQLEPRFKDQNVSYGLKNIMYYLLALYEPFWGVKIQKNFLVKIVIFEGYLLYDPNDPISTNGCQIQNQHTKLPLGAQKNEK